MGYGDKLQKLCVLRNVDQAALAATLGVSKSTISRILSGVQEPKLIMAARLARVLGVTLDYLMDDTQELDASHRMVVVSEDEATILKMVRRLGTSGALDRLLMNLPGSSSGTGPSSTPEARAGKTQGEAVPPRLEGAHGSTTGS